MVDRRLELVEHGLRQLCSCTAEGTGRWSGGPAEDGADGGEHHSQERLIAGAHTCGGHAQ